MEKTSKLSVPAEISSSGRFSKTDIFTHIAAPLTLGPIILFVLSILGNPDPVQKLDNHLISVPLGKIRGVPNIVTMNCEKPFSEQIKKLVENNPRSELAARLETLAQDISPLVRACNNK